MQEVQHKVSQFFSAFPAKHYDDGSIIIRPEVASPQIHFLEEGAVQQYSLDVAGDETIITRYKPGSFFPMLNVLTRIPNKYFFQASEPSQMRIAPAEDVVQWLTSEPVVALDLLRRVYLGMDGILQRLEVSLTGDARSRISVVLRIAALRFGEKINNTVQIYITHEELARAAGLSRETVSREVHALVKEGVLQQGNGEIIITDPALFLS